MSSIVTHNRSTQLVTTTAKARNQPSGTLEDVVPSCSRCKHMKIMDGTNVYGPTPTTETCGLAASEVTRHGRTVYNECNSERTESGDCKLGGRNFALAPFGRRLSVAAGHFMRHNPDLVFLAEVTVGIIALVCLVR
jgi:hypothetical protein